MTNSGIDVDDKDLIIALANMSWKKMNKAYNDGMKKALDPILKQTKANLRTSGIKGINKKYVSRKTGKTYKSMLQGVRTSVDCRKEDDAYGKVHIMSEFRLKYFEKGTTLRKTSKGYNRGSIKPKWFFKNAVNQKSKEAADSLDDAIRESIKKAWENKR